MTASLPTAEAELAFLMRLRALLADGEFNSTYKFALLRAIADECVERPVTEGRMEIPVQRLGERFIELYWRQARPYLPGRTSISAPAKQLLQNRGRQAAVVTLIAKAQEKKPLLAGLQRDKREWKSLGNRVAGVVSEMPLYRLQTVARQKDKFLYSEDRGSESISLFDGVAYLLRKHHGLVRDLIEVAWMRFIQTIPANEDLLGHGQELSRFLFGTDRKVLKRIAAVLAARDGGRCFYCDRPLSSNPHVDHFIPWSRYSLDLGHNFVLSDERCNLDKGTCLPAARHLAKWTRRNVATGQDYVDAMVKAGVRCDLAVTASVAEWAYSADVATGAGTWIGVRGRLESAGEDCLSILGECSFKTGSPATHAARGDVR